MSLRRESVVAWGVVLALLSAGCGGGGTLGAKALLQESKSLRSEAAEGALLAQDAASGRATRIFARERSAELYQAASGAAGSLKAANAESGLGVKLRQLVAVASRVTSDLMRLGGASSGEQRVIGRELQAAALESRRIGESLG